MNTFTMTEDELVAFAEATLEARGELMEAGRHDVRLYLADPDPRWRSGAWLATFIYMAGEARWLNEDFSDGIWVASVVFLAYRYGVADEILAA